MGRLVQTLIKEHVDVDVIAKMARLTLTDLCGCACGLHRLRPDEQMRLAAAVAGFAPDFSSRAHAIYAQAQMELHLRATANEISTRSESLVARAQQATAQSLDLTREAERLRSVASALCDTNSDIRSQIGEYFKDEVVRLTVLAKRQGESAESALTLAKNAVEPLLAGASNERAAIMKQLVNWCVDAYYAA